MYNDLIVNKAFLLMKLFILNFSVNPQFLILFYFVFRNCPECLVPHLIKIVIEEMRKACKKQPISCGFVVNDNGKY